MGELLTTKVLDLCMRAVSPKIWLCQESTHDPFGALPETTTKAETLSF
jgi:hypothetical protein